MLAKVRDKVVEAVYLIGLSSGLYNTLMISFVLVTTNLDRVQKVLPWNAGLLVLLLVPRTLLLIVGFSFFLDKYVGYGKTYASRANKGNPEILAILSHVKSIEERLDRMEKKRYRWCKCCYKTVLEKAYRKGFIVCSSRCMKN